MKFRVFTNAENGRKVAVNVDHVKFVDEIADNKTIIYLTEFKVADIVCDGEEMPNVLVVNEDFHTVISRLNTIAE